MDSASFVSSGENKMFDTLAQMNIAALFDNVVQMRMTAQVLTTCIVFSTIGACILGKFTGNFGNVTYPLNFSVLFIGSFIANCAFDGLDIASIHYQQQVLMLTVGGMISASFGLLWLSGARNT
jgi:hypothetical protein